MNYFDLTETEAYRKLCTYCKGRTELKKLLTADSVEKYVAPAGKNLSFSYAGKGITPELLKLCQSLADEQECIAKYRALLAGAIANRGENRAVLHHLCRGTAGLPVSEKTAENAAFYGRQKEQFFAFADKVRSGAVKSSTGKVIDQAKWNPNGGAIAIGHPNGASGGRIAMFTMKQLEKTGGKYGIFSSCCGGGHGTTTIIENLRR